MYTASSITQLAAFALLVVLVPRSRAVPDLLFKNKGGSNDVQRFGVKILGKNDNIFAKNSISAPLRKNGADAIPQNVLGQFSYFGKKLSNQEVRVCN